jgi:uncharacterized protein (TIGR02611 family)
VTERHPVLERLQERKRRHRRRPRIVRYGVAVLGGLITLAGVVMTGPVPGPGFLVIPVGLTLLALEFEWAERLLEKAVLWADGAREKARDRPRSHKVATGVAAAVALAAFVAAALRYDIPLLPV